MKDVEYSIYEGLRALDWHRYLCAMWIVCGELRELYSDRLRNPELSLIEATLELIRTVAMSGEVSRDVPRQALDLDAKWFRIIDDEEDTVFPGHWNMWMVFGMLASEIGGDCQLYSAAERVTLALTMRFREGKPRIRVMARAEEIDDESPMALLLSRAQRIVAGVARMPDAVRDPAVARDLLFSSS